MLENEIKLEIKFFSTDPSLLELDVTSENSNNEAIRE